MTDLFSSLDRVVIGNIIKFLHPIYASSLRLCSRQLREFVPKPPRWSPNQLLVEAAATGDIDLCKLALSRGAKDYSSMLKEFMKTRNIQGAQFVLDFFKDKISSPAEAFSGVRATIFRLVGLVGDKEMRLRIMGLFDRFTKSTWLQMLPFCEYDGVRLGLQDECFPPMLEGAAESGRLDVCEEILPEVRSNREMLMIEGGSCSDSVAVCQRAIDLGAYINSRLMVNAALYGSFDVFSLLLERFVSTVGHSSWDGRLRIEEAVIAGRDSVRKLDHLLSVLHSVGKRLKWTIMIPNDILIWASAYGNVEMCRYAKEKGATDLTLVYEMKYTPITREVLELGIEWGVDINKLNCYFLICNMNGWHDAGPDSPPVVRDHRKEIIDTISQLYHLLHEHGYRKYYDMLKQSISPLRSRELIEMVVRWGKDDLREGDEDYEEFTKLYKSLPDTPEALAAQFPDDPHIKPPQGRN
jgi:hypothetical protein